MMLMASSSSTSFSTIGFFAGIGAAVVMGYVIYILEKRIPLSIFFRCSSAILLIFAAMMMSGGIHELVEFAELQ
jgi:high-affinity iron transporter